MECPHCRADLADDDTRCRFCGTRIAPPPAAAQPAAPPDVPTAQPEPPRPWVPRTQGAAPLPGQNLALASLICSLTSIVLCSCLAPVGGVLGYQALQQLPPEAESSTVLQAKIGMWVGGIMTALMALVIAFFMLLFVVGIASEL